MITIQIKPPSYYQKLASMPGAKLLAIRELRQDTGIGLKEAKDAIESQTEAKWLTVQQAQEKIRRDHANDYQCPHCLALAGVPCNIAPGAHISRYEKVPVHDYNIIPWERNDAKKQNAERLMAALCEFRKWYVTTMSARDAAEQEIEPLHELYDAIKRCGIGNDASRPQFS